jgi:hypothetical protein
LYPTHAAARVPSNPDIAPRENYPTPSIYVHIRNNENQLHGGRGLRVRLRVAQLVKKISAFFGTPRFMGYKVQQSLLQNPEPYKFSSSPTTFI